MKSDPALEEELARLDADQRVWVERQLSLRAQAADLARVLCLDADDVFHILRHLARSPAERLELGLRHGRLLHAADRG